MNTKGYKIGDKVLIFDYSVKNKIYLIESFHHSACGERAIAKLEYLPYHYYVELEYIKGHNYIICKNTPLTEALYS